jgi:ring-1,2-phenylacetyl-CoA epoxidase subunit PaaD
MVNTTLEPVIDIAGAVADPELPVVTIAELGILRDARWCEDVAEVTITPTYSGCPAMDVIRADIVAALQAAGYPDVEIRTVFAPAWTTDWVTETGRAKLAAAGIAPPGMTADAAQGRAGATTDGRRRLLPLLSPPAPRCPRCDAREVAELSRFGPTACTSLWRCLTCREPFEHMKAH